MTQEKITNNGFWPDLSLQEFAEGYRVPQDSREAMQINVLRQSAIKVNEALESVARLFKQEGFATFYDWLAGNPAQSQEKIDGKPVAEHLYLAAVYNLAKAKTVKRLRQLQASRPSESEALATDHEEQFFLDEHHQVVTALLRRLDPEKKAASHYGTYIELI
jgi:hypothetical protein